MSNNQITKRSFWKSWIFGFFLFFFLIIVSYLLIVRIEETTYQNFINSEWSKYTIKYTEENSPLVGEYINNLTADNRGQVWIGTDSALNVVAPDGSWTTYTGTQEGTWTISTNDNKGVNVKSVAIDKLGRIWVGTFNGLYTLDPNGQWKTRDEKSKTVYESYTSNAIVIDHLDRIWVAHNDSLRVFLPDGTQTIYTTENSGLISDYVNALAVDKYDGIWVGTNKGISVFDRSGRWTTHQENQQKPGLVDNRTSTIWIDNQDRVWIGTESNGASMLSPDGNWTTYDVSGRGVQKNPTYADGEIHAFAVDEQGKLWIGTSDGLFVIESNGNSLAYTQVNSGLNPDYVRALTMDGSGRLWIATFHEVIVLDLRDQTPETVSDEIITRRAKTLAPIQMVTNMAGWLFSPAINFMYTSLYFCSVIYMTLLLMIIPAIIGVIWSDRQKNPKWLNASLWTLIISIVGVIILWFFSNLVVMIPT